MVPFENAADAAKGAAAGGLAGGALEAATGGLSQAAAAAGDVLTGIFGGLPWNMDPSGIVDAVSMQAVEAAAVYAPRLVEVLA